MLLAVLAPINHFAKDYVKITVINEKTNKMASGGQFSPSPNGKLSLTKQWKKFVPRVVQKVSIRLRRADWGSQNYTCLISVLNFSHRAEAGPNTATQRLVRTHRGLLS